MSMSESDHVSATGEDKGMMAKSTHNLAPLEAGACPGMETYVVAKCLRKENHTSGQAVQNITFMELL